MQNWIPPNATDVRIKISTTAQARPIARFILPDGQLPEQCTDLTDAVAQPTGPQLEADWMPKDAVSRATTICGDFAVITDESTVTAWDTRASEAT